MQVVEAVAVAGKLIKATVAVKSTAGSPPADFRSRTGPPDCLKSFDYPHLNSERLVLFKTELKDGGTPSGTQ